MEKKFTQILLMEDVCMIPGVIDQMSQPLYPVGEWYKAKLSRAPSHECRKATL